MPRSQFVVPQFIDVEPKILGPITARQFLVTLGTVLVDFIILSLAPGWVYAAVFGIPVTVTGIAFAFVRVNGQPFHYIALNMIQTLRRPSIRVWDKRLTDSELRVFMAKTPPPAPQAFQGKPPLAASRLSELTLVVDTGGVYQSNQE